MQDHKDPKEIKAIWANEDFTLHGVEKKLIMTRFNRYIHYIGYYTNINLMALT